MTETAERADTPPPLAAGAAEHPALAAVAEAAGTLSTAAGFLSPPSQLSFPGRADNSSPPGLDTPQTARLLQQLAGIAFHASSGTSAVIAQQAAPATAERGLFETAAAPVLAAVALQDIMPENAAGPGSPPPGRQGAGPDFPAGPALAPPAAGDPRGNAVASGAARTAAAP